MSSNSKTQKANSPQNNGSAPKVVGPNIKGNKEEYQLVMHLQSALFGGVYEAKGRSSGNDFAIKVLHKSELAKVQETNSIEFCEVPLSEIKFAAVMRGHEHVMEVEEHFEDQYCHYCVFKLCRGGDLLEALKQKPTGFEEQHAQFLIRQAAQGLAYLHEQGVSMQDVSLENMLLNVESNGCWQVKICDPGQAVCFEVDQNGQELPVEFRGLVGKSFRPPELHDHQPYLSTKVDSWCLGWSTFYLLTAQPLFMSADPAQKDADWILFQNRKFDELFKTKPPAFSSSGIDFIFRLLQLQPEKRMSIADACNHAWLTEKVPQMIAPKEHWPEELRRPQNEGEGHAEPRRSAAASGALPAGTLPAGTTPAAFVAGPAMRASPDLPSWSAAPAQHSVTAASQMGYPMTPMMRVRSPMRSPRQSAAQPLPVDRRSRVNPYRGNAARTSYVVATAHSPPPVHYMPGYSLRGNSGRASSPEQSYSETLLAQPCVSPQGPSQEAPRGSFLTTPRSTSRPRYGSGSFGTVPAPLPVNASQVVATAHSPPPVHYMSGYGLRGNSGRASSPEQSYSETLLAQPCVSPQGPSQEAPRGSFLTTPRSTSRHRSGSGSFGTVPAPLPVNASQATEMSQGQRGRAAWTFGSQDNHQVASAVQRVASPAPALAPVPAFAGVQPRRVLSPSRAVYVTRSPSPVDLQRSHSPSGAVRGTSGCGFSWTPAAISPGPIGGTAAMRTLSPSNAMAAQSSGPGVFAWSADPPSPHASPRTNPNTISFARAPSMATRLL
eukprot:TRINITY_DN1162_c0_g1_i1.p1 TRINITY_DN1162_c0_g1~~TRINITY_DN1162_c0_g1_i1.p1  ORF type:complete len:775 (+),score=112.63 TRINITY_DN1162_c0_g1_i1:111-2435(+)